MMTNKLKLAAAAAAGALLLAAAAAGAQTAPSAAAPAGSSAAAASAAASAAAPAAGREAASDEFDPAKNKRLLKISENLRCLVCQNQTIADSNADLAIDLRRQVRDQIAQGRTDEEIIRYMTDRYGDFVLYKPPFKATTALLWLGPAALLVLVLAWYVVTVRRRRKGGGHRPAPLTDEQRREALRLLNGGSDEGRGGKGDA